MGLSGQQIEDLSRLLAPTLEHDLEGFVHASTGDRLYVEYVGSGKPIKRTIAELLNVLDDRGTTAPFLRYVYIHRPGRDDIRQAIARLCPEAAVGVPDRGVALSAQTGGLPQPDAPNIAIAPGFQRNVRPHLPKLDVQIWLQNLIRIEHRVCRVELHGTALGTGFLVGPDAVLTNWHVIENAKAAGNLGELGCRFDYVQLPDGTSQAGQLVALHGEGCLDWSPYSPADSRAPPEDPPPMAQELDYALLRLASSVAQDVVDGTVRGWITLPAAPFPLAEDAPLLIVQHPEGGPMKLALDTQAVIGRNSNGTRVRYKTNTEPGSSGSPCFTMDWNVVALHHLGDPKWQNPAFNQGVPIELIRQSIQSRGFGSALGA